MNKKYLVLFAAAFAMGWFSYSFAEESNEVASGYDATSEFTSRSTFDSPLPIASQRNIDKTKRMEACSVGIRIHDEREMYFTGGIGGSGVTYLVGGVVELKEFPLHDGWKKVTKSFADIPIKYTYEDSVLRVESPDYSHPDHLKRTEFTIDRNGKSISRVQMIEYDVTGKELYNYVCEESATS